MTEEIIVKTMYSMLDIIILFIMIIILLLALSIRHQMKKFDAEILAILEDFRKIVEEKTEETEESETPLK